MQIKEARMPLDVIALASAVRDMTTHVVSGAAERVRQRAMIRTMLERHIGHEEHWNDVVTISDRTQWLLARTTEAFDTARAAPLCPDEYIIVATDGSQLDVERHGMAVCALINIGQVYIRYGAQPEAQLSSVPQLAYQDHDLYITTGLRRIPVEGQLLNAKRDAQEGIALAALAEAHQQGDIPIVALQDGTLMRWNLANSEDAVRTALLDPYLAALDRCKALGIPVASYISRPRSPEFLGMVRLMFCPDVRLPERRGAICDQCSDVRAGRAPSCRPCDDMADADVYADRLVDGQRGPISLSLSRANREFYREHAIHFFYLRVNDEIARVEVPQWVAQNAALVDRVHAVVYDQALRGQGYPVALARAHEQAIVRASDRRVFLQMVEQMLVNNELPALNSKKRNSKEFSAL
jgi:GNAT superfamily N-acetyltransferase